VGGAAERAKEEGGKTATQAVLEKKEAALSKQIAESRAMAIECHKAKRAEEAIGHMKRMKEMEQELQNLKRQQNTHQAFVQSEAQREREAARISRFHALEAKLVAFYEGAKREAKSALEPANGVDKQWAKENIERAKKYHAMLQTMRAKRQQPNQESAEFKVLTAERVVEVVNHDLKPDEVEVVVGSVSEMGAHAVGGSSVYCTFTLGLPKEAPLTFQTATVKVKKGGDGAAFECKKRAGGIRADRKSTVNTCTYKKATVQVFKAGSMFSSAKMLGQVRVSSFSSSPSPLLVLLFSFPSPPSPLLCPLSSFSSPLSPLLLLLSSFSSPPYPRYPLSSPPNPLPLSSPPYPLLLRWSNLSSRS
jgi:hypothetical protein